MCESNNESHALITDEDAIATLEKAAMTRQTASYERFKNTTSNLFWSIGNESSQGWTQRDGNYANGAFAHMVQYFKDRDEDVYKRQMLSGLFDRDRDIRSGISHASRGRINISSNIIYNVGQRKNNCW